MSDLTESNARHEVEDLWWFRHCVEHLVDDADDNATIRVGALRSLLETTRPMTSSTDPARRGPEAETKREEG